MIAISLRMIFVHHYIAIMYLINVSGDIYIYIYIYTSLKSRHCIILITCMYQCMMACFLFRTLTGVFFSDISS